MGYVYDAETGLYYLRSRYYKPQWQRFINTDEKNSTENRFAYCSNSPIALIDKTGFESTLAYETYNASVFTYQAVIGYLASLLTPVTAFPIILLGAVFYPVETADGSLEGIDTVYPGFEVTVSSESIDWGSGENNNHIRSGSKNHGGHDWSPFGIGPNDPNWWQKLLPLLKKVADFGTEWHNPNETRPIENAKYYIHYFEEFGNSIIIKLYFFPDGSIKLADAFPKR